MFHTERKHLLSQSDEAITGEVNSNPVDSEAHKTSREKFDELDPEDKEAYDAAADASNLLGHNVLIQSSDSLPALEDGDGEGTLGANVPHEQFPHPAPGYRDIVPMTTGSDENLDRQLYPVSTSDITSSRSSLKIFSQSWAQRTGMVRDPGPFSMVSAYKKGCVEAGACLHDWRQKKWPWWKRSKWLDNTHKFIKSMSVPIFWRHLPRPKIAELLMFDGYSGDVLATRLFFLQSLIAYTLVEYIQVGDATDAAASDFPYVLLPRAKSFVTTKRTVSGMRESTVGALDWRRHLDVATSMLAFADVPVMDERSVVCSSCSLQLAVLDRRT